MRDLKLNETGNGGDIELINSDFKTIDTIENEPYLSWFGGNAYVDEQGQWWGNLYDIEPDVQPIISLTETAIRENTLGSSGRQLIEDSAKNDLNYLSDRLEFDVSVIIQSLNSISITANIKDDKEVNSELTTLINLR